MVSGVTGPLPLNWNFGLGGSPSVGVVGLSLVGNASGGGGSTSGTLVGRGVSSCEIDDPSS